jgi:hypothetical protein
MERHLSVVGFSGYSTSTVQIHTPDADIDKRLHFDKVQTKINGLCNVYLSDKRAIIRLIEQNRISFHVKHLIQKSQTKNIHACVHLFAFFEGG